MQHNNLTAPFYFIRVEVMTYTDGYIHNPRELTDIIHTKNTYKEFFMNELRQKVRKIIQDEIVEKVFKDNKHIHQWSHFPFETFGGVNNLWVRTEELTLCVKVPTSPDDKSWLKLLTDLKVSLKDMVEHQLNVFVDEELKGNGEFIVEVNFDISEPYDQVDYLVDNDSVTESVFSLGTSVVRFVNENDVEFYPYI